MKKKQRFNKYTISTWPASHLLKNPSPKDSYCTSYLKKMSFTTSSQPIQHPVHVHSHYYPTHDQHHYLSISIRVSSFILQPHPSQTLLLMLLLHSQQLQTWFLFWFPLERCVRDPNLYKCSTRVSMYLSSFINFVEKNDRINIRNAYQMQCKYTCDHVFPSRAPPKDIHWNVQHWAVVPGVELM